MLGAVTGQHLLLPLATTFLRRAMACNRASGLASTSWIAVLLLLSVAQLPRTWAQIRTVNPVQGKILHDSQAGVCGSFGIQCLGWNSATSIPCALG